MKHSNTQKITLAFTATILSFLGSCQSAYVSTTKTSMQHGIATHTPDQRGIEFGALLGSETLALDVSLGHSSGDNDVVNSKRQTMRLGARVSAPRDWSLQPYISSGIIRERQAFTTESYDFGDSIQGPYARIGVLAPLGSGVFLDLSYQRADLNRADIGGRSDLDLEANTILVGFTLQF